MKRLVQIVCLFVISINAYAECSATGCSGLANATILSLYVSDNGNVFIETPSDRAALNCPLYEGKYMTLRPSHTRFKEVYGTLLTASAANKKIYIRTNEGSSGCNVAYVRMWN